MSSTLTCNGCSLNVDLANQLGATVFTFKGQDIADTILRFAREYRVDNIVIGRHVHRPGGNACWARRVWPTNWSIDPAAYP